jgi:hypothetical protein
MSVRKEDYQTALNSQSACNLSGVVFSFAEIMQRICDEAHEKGEGTDWKNLHPICRLFAEQIAHLSQGTSYFSAHAACQDAVED